MNRNIVRIAKKYVEENNITMLKNLYNDISNIDCEYTLNFPSIYKDIFFHACRQGETEIIIYLMCFYFDKFDDFTQILLRQMFPYGKYIMSPAHTEWYDTCILPLVRTK